MTILFSSPIHVAAVGVANLRFFPSPLDGPRQPWHSVEDMYACLALPRAVRRMLLQRLRQEWKADVRTVFTKPGQAIIAPHFMAQGIISGARELGHAPTGVDRAYTEGIIEAFKVATPDMSEVDRVNYAIAAFRNESGMDPDFERLEEPHPPEGRRIIR